MIKKVIIAAAGKGTRMLHLVRNKPKQLIRACNAPFLSYLLDNILNAGYEELILVVGYKKEKIEEFLNKHNYNIKVVNQFEVLGKDKYGTACALECVEDVIGNENFIMVYGDHLFSARDFKDLNIDDDWNYMFSFEHNNPQRYGVLNVENGFLKKIIEKPEKYIGNLINIGLYKFTPEIFEKLKKVKLSKRGEYEITDAINFLAKEKKMKVKKIHDYWLDFSNPADVMRVSKFLKNEKFKNNF